ncbi:MAG TPA: hypothetical protein VF101_02015 [Gaiellaceae bacterium]
MGLLSLPERGLAGAVRVNKPLVAVGRISYGLYLWHMLALWTVGSGHEWLGVALAFALAILSFRYVEQPIVRRKRSRPAPTLPVPALAPAG